MIGKEREMANKVKNKIKTSKQIDKESVARFEDEGGPARENNP